MFDTAAVHTFDTSKVSQDLLQVGSRHGSNLAVKAASTGPAPVPSCLTKAVTPQLAIAAAAPPGRDHEDAVGAMLGS